jgi:hypothetical protein
MMTVLDRLRITATLRAAVRDLLIGGEGARDWISHKIASCGQP